MLIENLMIDLLNTNEKLSDRSLRILVEASGKSVRSQDTGCGNLDTTCAWLW